MMVVLEVVQVRLMLMETVSGVVVLIMVETGTMVVVGKIVPDTGSLWAPGSVLRVLQNTAGLQVLRFLFCR